MTNSSLPDHDAFQRVVGEQPSGITFLQHDLQLQFNPPPIMNVYTPISIFSHGEFVRSSDDQFRNRMCEQISKSVESVSVVPGDAVKIRFEDASVIAASLKPSDYNGPEAIEFHDDEGW